MASDDSLLNEYEGVDVDSHGSFNNVVHLDDDDDEEADEEYHGEANDDEEQVLGNELELCDVDREMENEFTEEDVVVGPISGMRFRDKNTLSRIRKTKFTTKSNNCKARLAAVLDYSGCWRVSKVVHDHNHDLLSSISRPMAGHRSACDSLKRNLVAHDRSGIRPSKNIRLTEVQCGVPQNLSSIPKDCRNFILEIRNFEMQEGDAQSLLNFFREIQVKDREFFYSIDVDNIGRLRNVIWMHSHYKAAYEQFHDAICFDTTYLVNRYNMPCATFVGINHHRKSILLGCALMSHADIDSYKLVFRTWLDAMGNVHPDAIITNQCQSIRYCIWHIFSKLPLYLSGVRPSKIARGEFKSMVLDSITVEVLERKWTEYIARYNLHTRNWFNKLYSEKEKWVPMYLDVYFWAGMLSAQRSEGMHAFFDGYITRQSTLRMFVHQYELAIRAKHEKELEAEYRSKGFQIACESMLKWEEQAIQRYTRTVYEFFKTQLRKLYHCEVSSPDDHQVVPGVEKIIVSNYSVIKKNNGNSVEYTVEYIPIGDYFSCSCKWFESRGILCCHILKILSHKKIDKKYERYILTRWRSDVFRPHLKSVPSSWLPKHDS
ncbi:PREDICTED: protein FAR-RED IMPAIRED RESPONSE 1-like [Nicotiana attenuata]|uniref:protein FAR-RED IMPAIRED RESPONSE 1-like n=1 Tax=Nicotiana attenuata TaxID=49451 RepID=UPI0009049117|nr:PREDICTED: protein FAR-RED IMPAIRED RESPONSE 1-like [Nicotiana attenuata]